MAKAAKAPQRARSGATEKQQKLIYFLQCRVRELQSEIISLEDREGSREVNGSDPDVGSKLKEWSLPYPWYDERIRGTCSTCNTAFQVSKAVEINDVKKEIAHIQKGLIAAINEIERLRADRQNKEAERRRLEAKRLQLKAKVKAAMSFSLPQRRKFAEERRKAKDRLSEIPEELDQIDDSIEEWRKVEKHEHERTGPLTRPLFLKIEELREEERVHRQQRWPVIGRIDGLMVEDEDGNLVDGEKETLCLQCAVEHASEYDSLTKLGYVRNPEQTWYSN
jgi:hypothetical protein